MLKTLLTTATLLGFLSLNLKAQAPDTAWTKKYHRGNYDDCKWIEETSDSGFVLVGVSEINSNPIDILLVRTDAEGDTLWTHSYGCTIGQNASCVREDHDGGFVIAGYMSLSMTLKNAWIIKTDSQGDTVWTARYGGDRNAEAFNVSCTPDSGYIVTGRKYDPGQFANVFLLKLTSQGGIEWARTFGGPGYEEGYSVQQTADGGYMVAGSKDSTGRGYDFYLIRTDADGILQWSRTYGGLQYDHCTSAEQTIDGGYIMFGESDSYIPNSSLAVKTDASGDTLWTKVYHRSNGDYGWSVYQASDGGFIFGGYTNNPGFLDDYWFVRTDANGDTLWMKSVGHGDDQRGYRVLQASDGGYVLAGYSSEGVPTGGDFFVVKLNGFTTGIHNNRSAPNAFVLYQNYPNPFNPGTTIRYGLARNSFVMLTVYNTLGQQVAQLVNELQQAGDQEIVFRSDGLASGVYFYRLQAGGVAETRKFVVLR